MAGPGGATPGEDAEPAGETPETSKAAHSSEASEVEAEVDGAEEAEDAAGDSEARAEAAAELPGGLPAGLPGLPREVELLDELLAKRPVPEDVQAWRAASDGSFEGDWRDLPGTVHEEPAYLAVSLVRHEGLAAAEALLHLRVPAGTPATFLNAFDRERTLPAPSLLLARGLRLLVHSVSREDGQWYVVAEILRDGRDFQGRQLL